MIKMAIGWMAFCFVIAINFISYIWLFVPSSALAVPTKIKITIMTAVVYLIVASLFIASKLVIDLSLEPLFRAKEQHYIVNKLDNTEGCRKSIL